MTIPLDAWIDDVGLREFVEKHVKIHMYQWSVDDPDGLARLIMISLRQELREAGWTPPVGSGKREEGEDNERDESDGGDDDGRV